MGDRGDGSGDRGVRRGRLAVAALLLVAAAGPGLAQEISVNGLADLRLIRPSHQRSWLDGGLGKLGYAGGGDQAPDLRLAGLFLDTKMEFGSQFNLFTSLRHDPRQDETIDALEAYARYRTLSSGPWEGTLKLGAFFPPISLENEGVGWTSPWTLSSSAINTWVGEELRTIGGEATVEWQYESGAIQLIGALSGYSGPAGTLLAYRGWSVGDRATGLFDRNRQPDTAASRQRHGVPMRNEPFVQIGNALSWYGGLAWRHEDLGRIVLLHYDNEANPHEFKHDQFGWATRFTSLALETYVGDTVLLAQAMVGSTQFDPSPTFNSVTRFQSAYLLAGRYFGTWTAAARIEAFATQEDHNGRRLDLSERGHALTGSLSWKPLRWLRLTGEALRVDSYRGDRVNEGVAPRAVETQYQLAARIFF